MDKLKFFESEKIKCRKFIDDIFRLIDQLDSKIENLKRFRIMTNDIINKFDIECYNYNLVDNIIESRNSLHNNVYNMSKLEKKLQYENKHNIDGKIRKICNINDLLDKSLIQLKEINKQDFSEVEKLQMNAIKKEVYDKYMLIKSSIDRDKLKRAFDKIQNKNFILKAIDIFFEREEDVDRKKENIFFAIHEIDVARAQILNNKEPKKGYRIIEIMAEIEIFLRENEREGKYKDEFKSIREIRANINDVFSIDKSELKQEIKKIQKSKLPVRIDRKMNKALKEKHKMIIFLTKNGYYEKTPVLYIQSNLQNLINKINIVSDGIKKSVFEK